MIQFNLLPDVKIEYIRSKQSKRLVLLGAVLVAGLGLGVFTLLFITVNFLQKQHINNLTKDIATNTAKLKSIDQIDRILTVQNQLTKLPELHDGKVEVSRMKVYTPLITPAQVSYSAIEINTLANTITFSGKADTIKTVNKFVDTLKFTKYTVNDVDGEKNAFSEVVLVSFSTNDEGVNYSIALKYDPVIFDNNAEVSLNVPNIITTRSAIERPDENLLQPSSQNTTTEGL